MSERRKLLSASILHTDFGTEQEEVDAVLEHIGKSEQKKKVAKARFTTLARKVQTGAFRKLKSSDAPGLGRLRDISRSLPTNIEDPESNEDELPSINEGSSTASDRSDSFCKSSHNRQEKWFISSIISGISEKVLDIESPVVRLFSSTLVFLIIPCIGMASLLFYALGNPSPHFLSIGITYSYWFIFIAREAVLFDLAYLIQYLVVDKLAMESTALSTKIFGSFITLTNIKSRGWPFIMTFWGILNVFLMHGPSDFAKYWIIFTDIRMFSEENSDNGLLESGVYSRILLSFIIVGSLVSFKRACVTLYFGKRTLLHFKPQLEELITDMCVISYIACDLDSPEDVERNPYMFYSSPNFMSESAIHLNKLDKNDDESEHVFLNNWKDPINKMDIEETNPTIIDILHFNMTLDQMDNMMPFTESYGPADTRINCVNSAKRLFRKLKLYAAEKYPTETKKYPRLLPYRVLSELCEHLTKNENHEQDQLQKSLKKLFHPGKNHLLSLQSFVISCDNVYKRLKNLRASVANSSAIDIVLGDMFNIVFYFLVGLLVMVILNMNPFGLLLSITSVIVSFAFALGPTVSTLIEGIMFVAVRRPYDIGDRISILKPDKSDVDTMGNTWFVEDVTLYTTTLRFANTGEVSTVNNSSISSLRVINCARSAHALVDLNFYFSIETTASQMKDFKSAIDEYAKEHSICWKSITKFWIRKVDTNEGLINYNLQLQHQDPWQNMSLILMDRGKLYDFCLKVISKLQIQFVSRNENLNVFMQSSKEENSNPFPSPFPQSSRSSSETTGLRPTSTSDGSFHKIVSSALGSPGISLPPTPKN